MIPFCALFLGIYAFLALQRRTMAQRLAPPSPELRPSQ